VKILDAVVNTFLQGGHMKHFRINFKKDLLGAGALAREGDYKAWQDHGTEKARLDYTYTLRAVNGHGAGREITLPRRIDVKRIIRRARKAGVDTRWWGYSGLPV
jgi:hypothetical protein